MSQVTKTASKKTSESPKQHSLSAPLASGDYAYTTLMEQYHSTIRHEKKVLADKDPEDLHHMRVGTRRWRTALQVFDSVVQLPKQADEKHIGKFAKILGTLRDLDVQIAELQTTYLPKLSGKEQKLLDEVIEALGKKRKDALAEVKDEIARSRYHTLKETYETWFTHPQYTPLARLPLLPLLPDLLSPLLAELLLHPAWLVSAEDAMTESTCLHELRKTCKHVRYQTEFFAPFYGDSFQEWIKEIKLLQEQLGKLQDSQILTELLAEHLPKKATLPTLEAMIHQTRIEALANWDEIRQKYLDPAFRDRLHRMILEPAPLSS
jgi:CHAD domain-containing protein